MYCKKCGYNLCSIHGKQCPECGRKFNPKNQYSYFDRRSKYILFSKRFHIAVALIVCVGITAAFLPIWDARHVDMHGLYQADKTNLFNSNLLVKRHQEIWVDIQVTYQDPSITGNWGRSVASESAQLFFLDDHVLKLVDVRVSNSIVLMASGAPRFVAKNSGDIVEFYLDGELCGTYQSARPGRVSISGWHQNGNKIEIKIEFDPSIAPETP